MGLNKSQWDEKGHVPNGGKYEYLALNLRLDLNMINVTESMLLRDQDP